MSYGLSKVMSLITQTAASPKVQEQDELEEIEEAKSSQFRMVKRVHYNLKAKEIMKETPLANKQAWPSLKQNTQMKDHLNNLLEETLSKKVEQVA